MKIILKLSLLTILVLVSCTKKDDNMDDATSGTKISQIINNPSDPTFKLEFKYNQNTLTEVALPIKETSRKIEYENEIASAINHYVNNEFAGTTKLIYQNNKLVKTDNGEDSNNYLEFSYTNNKLSKVEQFFITDNQEITSQFTMEYVYDNQNVSKRVLTSDGSKTEYVYTYDNKDHYYNTIPESLRIYFFWPEGISVNNPLTTKIYSDEMFNSESNLEYIYNDLDLPTSRKQIDKDVTTVFTYE
ncbi:hypothetical protein [Cellulophaga baltica]|uniref:hypothetical protein n=1 Tax=Cellulophaga baltica TaxID=76594 RepID=UPI0003FB0B55|nr:hypothetical protein [Cellulophaga baltica]